MISFVLVIPPLPDWGVKDMRGTQIARQWKILRLIELNKRGLTAQNIATKLEADLRTVYRDLQALQPNSGDTILVWCEGWWTI